MRNRLIWLAITPLLFACSQAEKTPPEAAVKDFLPSVSYLCDSGEMVEAAYTTEQQASIRYKQHIHAMQITASASGAKYQGSSLTWWTKGSGAGSEAMLLDQKGQSLEHCKEVSMVVNPVAAQVVGEFTIPKRVGSFDGLRLELTLFKYDPRIADKAAERVDSLVIDNFSHVQEFVTQQDFVLGQNIKLDPEQGYYLTLFVLDGQRRTHMGICQHSPDNLCKVLTQGGPLQVEFVVNPVDNRGEPSS
ncbi:MliC family protein [Bowmanella sp. Y26]|uniref:MliC family protein n=1 Tax=Bowmanella yangjiangensis TaxID=2811230 RepID=UPI001BDBBA89|nr:MliC family protein [Bowmanella yangjiangensis]MBT1064129.1 MliC family protein [Bowmanella yangjiangensis]